ncbi:MAG: hemolysin, partial [Defluviitaleaceae bacterium]|nr:hemolysin [Defluviitaleaceae bacterium]
MTNKERLDILLVKRGFFESREKAKASIMAGQVLVNGMKEVKAGMQVDENANIEVKEVMKYVSRGGFKLEKAIEEFSINLKNKIALDVGASTGGFTDCMLQNGAKKVYAIDVGYGQFAWKLRQDERVVCM